MLAAAALQNPFLALLGLAVIVLAILVVITYIIRVAALVVLAAAAPLLIGHTLPQTERYARAWWRAMLALLVAPAAQSPAGRGVPVLLTSDGVLGLPIGSGFIDILVVGTSCTSCSRSRSGCCTQPSPVPRRERSRRRSDRQRRDEGGERRVRIRVPADVDMADRIFAGLTARQLAIIGAHGLVLLALYAVLGERLPPALLGVLAVPVCLLGLLWATTSLEGATWEQLGFAALRHFAKPRRRVPAPESIPESPVWIREGGALAPLEFPAVSASSDGHVDLGGTAPSRSAGLRR